MSSRLSSERLLALLERDTARIAACLRVTEATARVPTCPDWTAADLLRHLTRTHAFWADVVAGRLTDEADVRALDTLHTGPSTGTGHPDAQAHLDTVTALVTHGGRLYHALASTPATTPVWTWAPERTAAFVLRRLTHESTIHRLDAEATAHGAGARIGPFEAAAPTPIDVALADDGVDEVLRVFHGAAPADGRLEPLDEAWLRMVATDTGSTWLLRPARRHAPRGAYPASGIAVEVADVDHADGTLKPRALVSGTAEDLYRWLWGRPPITAPTSRGTSDLVGHLDALVGLGLD